MAKRSGYRSTDSYHSKDPEKRARQLANLKQGRQKRTADIEKFRADVVRAKEDIFHFAEWYFYIPETRNAIVLLDWEKDILHDLFGVPIEQRPTLALLGMPKKSGKSTIAAMIGLWYLFAKPLAEIYIMGPDFQQGQLVVFDKICKAIRLHPWLRQIFKVGKDSIENKQNGAKITVLPCSKTAAGLNPDLVIFDELWQFTSLEARRSIDELTNVPEGLKHNLILVVSYAGYESDEDSHLYRWYREGMDIAEGKIEPDAKFYFIWRTDYDGVPWVDEKYLTSQRRRLRKNAYLRLHQNAWVSSEEAFIEARVITLCTDKDRLQGFNLGSMIIVGLDVGYKHDASALAAVGKENEKLVLIDHRIFIPPTGGELNLQKTIEETLLSWNLRYKIVSCLFDPYQAIRTAQHLAAKEIPMQEYPQTPTNLVAIADNLQSLLKTGNLILYENEQVRRHLINAAVKESSRGWRIVKSIQSRKIDFTIALAMAALGAVQTLWEDREACIIDTGMVYQWTDPTPPIMQDFDSGFEDFYE